MRRIEGKLDPERSDFPHGSYTGYQYGCRDECCQEARRKAQGKRSWEEYLDAVKQGHGTRASYQRECRTDEMCPLYEVEGEITCAEANRRYSRETKRLYNRGLSLRDPLIEEALHG